MIPKFQSLLLEKTYSTIPTIHQINPPAIHSYHQYETLLYYITSFITDFKLHIVELKELVYHLSGIQFNYFNDQKGHIFDNCEYCQVQFMMNSCRKARQDIVRILAVLRGLSRNHELKDEAFTQKFIYPENEAIISRIKEKSDITYLFDYNKRYSQNNYTQQDFISVENQYNAEILNNNQVGFLTFRQNKICEDTNKISKVWSDQFKIQQEINQTSKSLQSFRGSEFCNNQLSDYYQGKFSSQFYSDRKQGNDKNFQRAFQLLKLIKKQMHSKPMEIQNLSEEQSKSIKVNKQMSENTLSPTLDSPFRLDLTDP